MALNALRSRRVAKKLERAFSDLVVKSHFDGEAHHIEIAIVLGDPDFSDVEAWAPSLAVRVHAANLVILIPVQFPGDQAVVSVRRLPGFPLDPHPLLKPTQDRNVYQVDYHEVEYRQSHTASSTLIGFVDALLRALCSGPDPLTIQEYFEYWRSSNSAGRLRRRRSSRGKTPRGGSVSGDFSLYGANVVHKAATHSALYPSDLEKLAVAWITGGKVGLLLKQHLDFEYFGFIRAFAANGLAYEKVRREDYVASLALLRLQMAWKRATADYVVAQADTSNAHSTSADQVPVNQSGGCFGPLTAVPAASQLGEACTPGAFGPRGNTSRRRRCWVCSPAAYFGLQRQREERRQRGIERQEQKRVEFVEEQRRKLREREAEDEEERLRHMQTNESGQAAPAEGDEVCGEEHPNQHKKFERKLSAGSIHNSARRSLRGRSKRPKTQQQQQIQMQRHVGPLLQHLLQRHPMDFSRADTPWKLIKCGQVHKRRSSHSLGGWKKRLLYVVEYHIRLAGTKAGNGVVHNMGVNNGHTSTATTADSEFDDIVDGPLATVLRLGLGQPTDGVRPSRTTSAPVIPEKIVFCITRPYIKGQDRSEASVARGLWPLVAESLGDAAGSTSNQAANKRAAKAFAASAREHCNSTLKSDIFDPPFKSSCFRVCSRDKTQPFVFRLASRRTHDREFAVRTENELLQWISAIQTTHMHCSFAVDIPDEDSVLSSDDDERDADADSTSPELSCPRAPLPSMGQDDPWHWDAAEHQWDVDKAIATLSRDRPFLEAVGLVPPADAKTKKFGIDVARLHMWLPRVSASPSTPVNGSVASATSTNDHDFSPSPIEESASEQSDDISAPRQVGRATKSFRTLSTAEKEGLLLKRRAALRTRPSQCGLRESNPLLMNLLPYEDVENKLRAVLQGALLPFVAAQQLYRLIHVHGHVKYVPTREYLRCVREKLCMDRDTFQSGNSGAGGHGAANGKGGAPADAAGDDDAAGGGHAHRSGRHGGPARTHNGNGASSSGSSGASSAGKGGGSPVARVLEFLALVRSTVTERSKECAPVIKNTWMSMLSLATTAPGTPRTPSSIASGVSDSETASTASGGTDSSTGRGGSMTKFEDVQFILNRQDTQGRTAFFEACATGNIPAVKFLTRMGANLTLPDWKGVSPLAAAQMNQHLDVAIWLLEMYTNYVSVEDTASGHLIADRHNLRRGSASTTSSAPSDGEDTDSPGMVPTDVATDDLRHRSAKNRIQKLHHLSVGVDSVDSSSASSLAPRLGEGSKRDGISELRALPLRLQSTISPAILRQQSVHVMLGDDSASSLSSAHVNPAGHVSRFTFSSYEPMPLLQSTLGVLQSAQATLAASLYTPSGKVVLRQQQKSFAGNIDQSYTYLLRILIQELKTRPAASERAQQAVIFAELDLELVMTMLLQSHRETIKSHFYFAEQILVPATRAKISRYFGELLRLQYMIIDMRQQLIGEILGWLELQRIFLQHVSDQNSGQLEPQDRNTRSAQASAKSKIQIALAAKNQRMLACVQHMVLLHGLEHGQEQQRLCWTIMRSVSTKKQDAFRHAMHINGIDYGDAFVQLYRPPRSIIDCTVAVQELMDSIRRVNQTTIDASIAIPDASNPSTVASPEVGTSLNQPAMHGHLRDESDFSTRDLLGNLSHLLHKMRRFEQNGSGAGGVLISSGPSLRKTASMKELFGFKKRRPSPAKRLSSKNNAGDTSDAAAGGYGSSLWVGHDEPPSPTKTSAERAQSKTNHGGSSAIATTLFAARHEGARSLPRNHSAPPRTMNLGKSSGHLMYGTGDSQTAIEMSPSLLVPNRSISGGGGSSSAPYVPTLRRRMTVQMPAQARRLSLLNSTEYQLPAPASVEDSATDPSEFSDTSSGTGDDETGAAAAVAFAVAAGAGARARTPSPTPSTFRHSRLNRTPNRVGSPLTSTGEVTSAAMEGAPRPPVGTIGSESDPYSSTFRNRNLLPGSSRSRSSSGNNRGGAGGSARAGAQRTTGKSSNSSTARGHSSTVSYFSEVPVTAFESVQMDRLGPQLTVRCVGAQLFQRVRRRHSGSFRYADIACVLTLAGAPLITSFVRAGVPGTKWGRKCVWQLREPVASLYLTAKIVLGVPRAHEGNDGEPAVLGQCIIPIASLFEERGVDGRRHSHSRLVRKRLWFSLYSLGSGKAGDRGSHHVSPSRPHSQHLPNTGESAIAHSTSAPAYAFNATSSGRSRSMSAQLRPGSSAFGSSAPTGNDPARSSGGDGDYNQQSPKTAGAIWLDIVLDMDGLYRNEELFVPALELQRLALPGPPNFVNSPASTDTETSELPHMPIATKKFTLVGLDDQICWQFKYCSERAAPRVKKQWSRGTTSQVHTALDVLLTSGFEVGAAESAGSSSGASEAQMNSSKSQERQADDERRQPQASDTFQHDFGNPETDSQHQSSQQQQGARKSTTRSKSQGIDFELILRPRSEMEREALMRLLGHNFDGCFDNFSAEFDNESPNNAPSRNASAATPTRQSGLDILTAAQLEALSLPTSTERPFQTGFDGSRNAYSHTRTRSTGGEKETVLHTRSSQRSSLRRGAFTLEGEDRTLIRHTAAAMKEISPIVLRFVVNCFEDWGKFSLRDAFTAAAEAAAVQFRSATHEDRARQAHARAEALKYLRDVMRHQGLKGALRWYHRPVEPLSGFGSGTSSVASNTPHSSRPGSAATLPTHQSAGGLAVDTERFPATTASTQLCGLDMKVGVMSRSVRQVCAAELRKRHLVDVPFLCSPHVFARQYYFRAAGTYKVWRTSMPTEAVHLWQPRTVKSSLRTLRSRVPLAPGDKAVFQFKVWSVGVAGIVIGVCHRHTNVEECIGLKHERRGDDDLTFNGRRAEADDINFEGYSSSNNSDSSAGGDDGDDDYSDDDKDGEGNSISFDQVLNSAVAGGTSRRRRKRKLLKRPKPHSVCRSWGYSSDGLLQSDGHFRFGGIEYEAGAFLQLHVDVPSPDEPRGRMMLRDSHGNVSDNIFDDLCLGGDSNGNGHLYIAVSLSEGAEVWLKNTNEERLSSLPPNSSLQSAESSAALSQLGVRNDIILADEKLQREIRDRLMDTFTRGEYLEVLKNYSRELSALSLPVRDAVSTAQVRRDLCREKLWINGEEYAGHLADAGGLEALQEHLQSALLACSGVGSEEWLEEGGASIPVVIDWILQACSRTLSGGDAYFALFSLLPCDHMTPSHLREHKDTEIFISAENIVVKTNNIFDLLIQQPDDSGTVARGRAATPSVGSVTDGDGEEGKGEIVVSTLILEQLPLRVEPNEQFCDSQPAELTSNDGASRNSIVETKAESKRDAPAQEATLRTVGHEKKHIPEKVAIGDRVRLDSQLLREGSVATQLRGTVAAVNHVTELAALSLDWTLSDGKAAQAFVPIARLLLCEKDTAHGACAATACDDLESDPTLPAESHTQPKESQSVSPPAGGECKPDNGAQAGIAIAGDGSPTDGGSVSSHVPTLDHTDAKGKPSRFQQDSSAVHVPSVSGILTHSVPNGGTTASQPHRVQSTDRKTSRLSRRHLLQDRPAQLVALAASKVIAQPRIFSVSIEDPYARNASGRASKDDIDADDPLVAHVRLQRHVMKDRLFSQLVKDRTSFHLFTRGGVVPGRPFHSDSTKRHKAVAKSFGALTNRAERNVAMVTLGQKLQKYSSAYLEALQNLRVTSVPQGSGGVKGGTSGAGNSAGSAGGSVSGDVGVNNGTVGLLGEGQMLTLPLADAPSCTPHYLKFKIVAPACVVYVLVPSRVQLTDLSSSKQPVGFGGSRASSGGKVVKRLRPPSWLYSRPRAENDNLCHKVQADGRTGPDGDAPLGGGGGSGAAKEEDGDGAVCVTAVGEVEGRLRVEVVFDVWEMDIQRKKDDDVVLGGPGSLCAYALVVKEVAELD